MISAQKIGGLVSGNRMSGKTKCREVEHIESNGRDSGVVIKKFKTQR